MRTSFRLVVPAALLLAALTACGSGAAAPAAAPAPAGNQQTAATGAPAGQAPAKKKEEPLTGDLKKNAEKAALAKYPGTVLKSEHDAEKPGMYAVEIKQSNGETVEVYLDTSYKVSGTKDEGKDTGQGDGDGD